MTVNESQVTLAGMARGQGITEVSIDGRSPSAVVNHASRCRRQSAQYIGRGCIAPRAGNRYLLGKRDYAGGPSHRTVLEWKLLRSDANVFHDAGQAPVVVVRI